MSHDPADMVVLTSARSEVHAGLLTSILESHGVPAFSPSAAASTLRWEVGATDPYRVYVRRGEVERAREILSRERADSVDIDWNDVDVGKDPPSPVPTEHSAPGWGGPALVLLIVVALFVAVAWLATSNGMIVGW